MKQDNGCLFFGDGFKQIYMEIFEWFLFKIETMIWGMDM